MKQPIKVVMLPTEDKSLIWFNPQNNTANLFKEAVNLPYPEFGESQHLYVTVSQDVIGGKEVYYIDKFTNKVASSGGAEYGEKQDVIIATTDPKLHICVENKCTKDVCTFPDCFYPSVQQSFLKEFVANPDGEYEVEYEVTKDASCKSELDFCVECSTYILKLNQDNTVNITFVEYKMYSLEEMYLSAVNVVNQIAANKGNSDWNMKTTPKMIVDNWIKENL